MTSSDPAVANPLPRRMHMRHTSTSHLAALATAAAVGLLAAQAAFAQGARVFATPEEASAALAEAAKNKDANAILGVLGPSTREWIVSGDTVQDEEARSRFVSAYDKKHVLIRDGDAKAVLEVGDDGYPFPFPLVKVAAGWAFDPELGKEELLNRRIGENELNAIQVLLAIVDAQLEYASADRDGDGLLEYAARFASKPGAYDGLYWPSAEGEPQSPLGELVLRATAEGYKPQAGGADKDQTSAYHGYRFKLLLRQGPEAPGGAHDYAVDGNMVGGFAVLAWPAKYGASGIMTFAVSHEGTVYETDLGPQTDKQVQAIAAFSPDDSWVKVNAR